MTFKPLDRVEVVDGPHEGYSGKILAVLGRMAYVTLDYGRGTYHIPTDYLRHE